MVTLEYKITHMIIKMLEEGIDYYYSLKEIPPFRHKQIPYSGCFLCSVFFIRSQVTMTTTTFPVTFVFSALTTTVTVTILPNSVGLAAALG